MRVTSINTFKKIDINALKTYNNAVFRQLSKDTCCFSGRIIRIGMDKEDISKLAEIGILKESIVDFIPDMLNNYAQGKISYAEFAQNYLRTINGIKFSFSQISPDLMKENQTVFKKEFRLADRINKVSKDAQNKDKRTFDMELTEIIKEYIASYQDDACGK